MRAKRRAFDCVAMKRQAADEVYELTKDMSFEEKVAFWRRESAAFLKEKKAVEQRMAEPGGCQ